MKHDVRLVLLLSGKRLRRISDVESFADGVRSSVSLFNASMKVAAFYKLLLLLLNVFGC